MTSGVSSDEKFWNDVVSILKDKERVMKICKESAVISIRRKIQEKSEKVREISAEKEACALLKKLGTITIEVDEEEINRA